MAGSVESCNELAEAGFQLLQHGGESLVIVQQLFVLRPGAVTQLSIVVLSFGSGFGVVIFDAVAEVVDVNELDVELIFEVVYIREFVFAGDFAGDLPELVF